MEEFVKVVSQELYLAVIGYDSIDPQEFSALSKTILDSFHRFDIRTMGKEQFALFNTFRRNIAISFCYLLSRDKPWTYFDTLFVECFKETLRRDFSYTGFRTDYLIDHTGLFSQRDAEPVLSFPRRSSLSEYLVFLFNTLQFHKISTGALAASLGEPPAGQSLYEDPYINFAAVIIEVIGMTSSLLDPNIFSYLYREPYMGAFLIFSTSRSLTSLLSESYQAAAFSFIMFSSSVFRLDTDKATFVARTYLAIAARELGSGVLNLKHKALSKARNLISMFSGSDIIIKEILVPQLLETLYSPSAIESVLDEDRSLMSGYFSVLSTLAKYGIDMGRILERILPYFTDDKSDVIPVFVDTFMKKWVSSKTNFERVLNYLADRVKNPQNYTTLYRRLFSTLFKYQYNVRSLREYLYTVFLEFCLAEGAFEDNALLSEVDRDFVLLFVLGRLDNENIHRMILRTFVQQDIGESERRLAFKKIYSKIGAGTHPNILRAISGFLRLDQNLINASNIHVLADSFDEEVWVRELTGTLSGDVLSKVVDGIQSLESLCKVVYCIGREEMLFSERGREGRFFRTITHTPDILEKVMSAARSAVLSRSLSDDTIRDIVSFNVIDESNDISKEFYTFVIGGISNENVLRMARELVYRFHKSRLSTRYKHLIATHSSLVSVKAKGSGYSLSFQVPELCTVDCLVRMIEEELEHEKRENIRKLSLKDSGRGTVKDYSVDGKLSVSFDCTPTIFRDVDDDEDEVSLIENIFSAKYLPLLSSENKMIRKIAYDILLMLPNERQLDPLHTLKRDNEELVSYALLCLTIENKTSDLEFEIPLDSDSARVRNLALQALSACKKKVSLPRKGDSYDPAPLFEYYLTCDVGSTPIEYFENRISQREIHRIFQNLRYDDGECKRFMLSLKLKKRLKRNSLFSLVLLKEFLVQYPDYGDRIFSIWHARLLHAPDMLYDSIYAKNLSIISPLLKLRQSDLSLLEERLLESIKFRDWNSFSIALEILRGIVSKNAGLDFSGIWNGLFEVLRDNPPESDGNWFVDKEDESDSEYRTPGLYNVDNTCYLNSIFQQLCSDDLFTKYIIENTSGDMLLKKMKVLFSSMRLSRRDALKPHEVVHAITDWDGTPLDPKVQRDADEFLKLILSKTEFDGFDGELVHTIESRGEVLSRNKERFSSISLDVLENSDLYSSMRAFLTPSVFVGENQYFSEKYNKKVDAVLTNKFSKLPDTLWIHLKRFEYDVRTGERRKVNKEFSFPPKLDFKVFSDMDSVFELCGVVIHSGTIESGHYWSLVRKPSGVWYKFDDSRVTVFDMAEGYRRECLGGGEEGLAGTSAYLLVYKRIPLNSIKIEYPKKIMEAIERDNYRYYAYRKANDRAFLGILADILGTIPRIRDIPQFLRVLFYRHIVRNRHFDALTRRFIRALEGMDEKIVRRFLSVDQVTNLLRKCPLDVWGSVSKAVSACLRIVNDSADMKRDIERLFSEGRKDGLWDSWSFAFLSGVFSEADEGTFVPLVILASDLARISRQFSEFLLLTGFVDTTASRVSTMPWMFGGRHVAKFIRRWTSSCRDCDAFRFEISSDGLAFIVYQLSLLEEALKGKRDKSLLSKYERKVEEITSVPVDGLLRFLRNVFSTRFFGYLASNRLYDCIRDLLDFSARVGFADYSLCIIRGCSLDEWPKVVDYLIQRDPRYFDYFVNSRVFSRETLSRYAESGGLSNTPLVLYLSSYTGIDTLFSTRGHACLSAYLLNGISQRYPVLGDRVLKALSELVPLFSLEPDIGVPLKILSLIDFRVPLTEFVKEVLSRERHTAKDRKRFFMLMSRQDVLESANWLSVLGRSRVLLLLDEHDPLGPDGSECKRRFLGSVMSQDPSYFAPRVVLEDGVRFSSLFYRVDEHNYRLFVGCADEYNRRDFSYRRLVDTYAGMIQCRGGEDLGIPENFITSMSYLHVQSAAPLIEYVTNLVIGGGCFRLLCCLSHFNPDAYEMPSVMKRVLSSFSAREPDTAAELNCYLHFMEGLVFGPTPDLYFDLVTRHLGSARTVSWVRKFWRTRSIIKRVSRLAEKTGVPLWALVLGE